VSGRQGRTRTDALVNAGVLAASCFLSRSARAHGFGGSGVFHPLTGIDHMLAMMAVGAWSAQLGRRALWAVPAAFLLAMAAGGAVALCGGVPLGSVEWAIAGSVLALGLAIALRARFALPLAASATMLFGFAHGYSHGIEMPSALSPARYVVGFLATTAALHVAGAVVALLAMDRQGGPRALRLVGAAVAGAGLFLVLR
jgi:urease accessory protein